MNFLILISFVFFLVACNSTDKSMQVKDQFDAIEKIVGNGNWQLVDDQDTSYLYFSRIGDAQFNIYHYKINKGDSVNTIMNNITDQQDTVTWNWQDQQLALLDVTTDSMNWRKASDEKDKYVLKKMDSLHLSLIFPGKHELVMKLTLPLATFLVRSHYDYFHGSHSIDSAIVPPRHVLKK
jgi:peptide subunit release factor RF-3